MRIRTVIPAASIALSIVFSQILGLAFQQTPSPAPLTEEQQKAKDEREKKAVELLEQVLSEAQSMKLPENRIRIQITGGDLLWDRDESRARTLFLGAAAGIIDLVRALDPNDRQYLNLLRTPSQLRQELILTVARHESTLAYQLLASTRPPTPSQTQTAVRPGGPGGNAVDADANLERNLLSQIAAKDPTLALQNAEEMLAKGEYSSAMAAVLAGLQKKDKESAAKFQEKLLRKLGSENLLTTSGASALAMALLRNGPHLEIAQSQGASASATGRGAGGYLNVAAYRELLETVIASALKATPAPRGTQGGGQGNMRGNVQGGGTGTGTGGGQNASGQASGQGNGRRADAAPRPNAPTPAGGQNRGQVAQGQSSTLTTAQVEQNAARGLVGNLQSLLPQIDLYLPARAPALRQKMVELGVNPDQRRGGQFGPLLERGDSQSILAAAATAPSQSQPRLYQQAALKALEEGNIDGARQIANEHLESNLKASVLQTIDLQVMARTATAEKIDEIRQSVGRLKGEDERIKTLLQLAAGAGKQNEKLARDLLEDARLIVAKRPSTYQQFETQLRVARAFAPLDAAKAIEVLEPGITQLNDLLPAAALLSGFEVNIFKDGELPMQGGSVLTNTVTRYAQLLGALARNNFDLAVAAADKFQAHEARIIARMSIIRVALGDESEQAGEAGGPFGTGRGVVPNFPLPNRRQP